MDEIPDIKGSRAYWRNEKIAFLALSSIKGISFWSLIKIAKSGVGFNNLLRSPDTALVDKLRRDPTLSVEGAEQDILVLVKALWERGIEVARELHGQKVNLLFKDEIGFPEKLRKVPDSPEWLFIQGSPAPLYNFSVAIIGTRKPSEDGLFLARYLVAALANTGVATISGLAAGIDNVAHVESLRYGLKTIAVLGHGIDLEYPKGSGAVRRAIVEQGGCIVTEYLPSQGASAENFVRRNRIQAALCDALVPVEWQIKSGTAHTVNFAYKYGRRIVGLYLPTTFNQRPELQYACDNYQVKSFEAPGECAGLLAAIFRFDGLRNTAASSYGEQPSLLKD